MSELTAKKRKRGRPRLAKTDSAAPVQALDRGLQILQALAREGSLTLTDLGLLVGMPPSSAHRILATLQAHGFVALDAARQEWTIGIGLFRVGNAYLGRNDLIEVSRETMRNLMQVTGETANLGINEDGQIVFVTQVETQHPIRAFFRPGSRSHMHASGIGKALMAAMPRAAVEKILQKTGLPEFTANTLTTPEALFADLSESAARGWAFDDEERYSGMRCVAAPIYNGFGEAIAGISVSGPSVRFTSEVVLETGLLVRNAADHITHMIGGKKPTPP